MNNTRCQHYIPQFIQRYFDTFTGREWLSTIEDESSSRNMDTLETLCSIKKQTVLISQAQSLWLYLRKRV